MIKHSPFPTECIICGNPTCGCSTCFTNDEPIICTKCMNIISIEHNARKPIEKSEQLKFNTRQYPVPLSRVKPDMDPGLG